MLYALPLFQIIRLRLLFFLFFLSFPIFIEFFGCYFLYFVPLTVASFFFSLHIIVRNKKRKKMKYICFPLAAKHSYKRMMKNRPINFDKDRKYSYHRHHQTLSSKISVKNTNVFGNRFKSFYLFPHFEMYWGISIWFTLITG